LETAAANQALQSSQGSLRSTLYAAQMNLTKVAWESGAPARTLDLLAATIPKPGEPDLRGFEWHYWRKQAHGEQTVRKLPGFSQQMYVSRVFSPDGSLAATVEASAGMGKTRKLVVFETVTGRMLHKLPFELPRTSNNAFTYLRIAFSHDGKVVAIHIADALRGTSVGLTNQEWSILTIVWNLSDQRVLFHDSEMINASSALPDVSVDANGSRIATGLYLYDRTIQNSPVMLGSVRPRALGESSSVLTVGSWQS
jgi:hypothetical protein